jgi:hypothetical protein
VWPIPIIHPAGRQNSKAEQRDTAVLPRVHWIFDREHTPWTETALKAKLQDTGNPLQSSVHPATASTASFPSSFLPFPCTRASNAHLELSLQLNLLRLSFIPMHLASPVTDPTANLHANTFPPHVLDMTGSE